MYIGDFNEILYDYEKRGGAERPLAQMEQFMEVVQMCELMVPYLRGIEERMKI